MIQDSESNDAQPSKISFEESFKPDFTLSNNPIELIKNNTKENSKDNNIYDNDNKDSNNVSEDKKVHKKIMKEDNSKVDENQNKNEMKKNKKELENEKVKEIEKENYNKMVQEFNENVKKSNLWKKNKCLLTILKYTFLIIIITIFIIVNLNYKCLYYTF